MEELLLFHILNLTETKIVYDLVFQLTQPLFLERTDIAEERKRGIFDVDVYFSAIISASTISKWDRYRRVDVFGIFFDPLSRPFRVKPGGF